MKILITGGAGYIGSKLVQRLLDPNLGYGTDKITVFDTLMYDKTSLLSFISDPKLTFVKGDVRNDKALIEQVKKHDVVISLAALVGAPLCDKNPVDAELVNFRANKIIADNIGDYQLLIYPNTNSGYGSTGGTSFCTEKDPMKPVSIYGTTKLRAEEYIQQEAKKFVTLRLATVFGVSPRPRFDLLVNNLVLKAMKEKMIVLYENQAMRNYIHINDICRVIEHFICDALPGDLNQTYNAGNDRINCNKLQLVETIKKHVPVEIIQAEYTQDPDKRDYVVSSKKLYDTGFDCYFDLDYGIKELIKAVELIDTPINANY